MMARKPKEAFEAILSLVKENELLKKQVAMARISLGLMQTVITTKGLDAECKAEYDKLQAALKELK